MTYNWMNLARAAGMPLAANNPNNIMARQLGGTGGYFGGGPPPARSINPNVQAPPSIPLARGVPRFPRLRSVMQQLSSGLNVSPLAIGLLAASGPRPVGTSSFGSRLGEAFQFASAAEDARLQREMIQRQLDELERQRTQGSSLEGLIQKLSAGRSPTLSRQQADILSAAAQTDPRGATAALLDLLKPAAPPALSETGEKLRDVKDMLGRELTEREALTLAGAGELFEVSEDDDEADEPLSPTDLARVRQSNGSPFPFGTTAREAQEAGARVFSESELAGQRNVSRALGTLDTLEQMAVGPDGVFRDEGGSVVTNNILGRLGSGLANGIGWLLGTEDSVRREVFTDTARGSISSLVRSFGEAGALSDGDVARALGLIPTLGSSPDTEEKAKAKFRELRRIIERGVHNLGGSSGGSPDGSRINLGGGVTLEWEK